MSINWSSIATSVGTGAIAVAGGPATLTRTSGGTLNTTTLQLGSATETTYPIKLVMAGRRDIWRGGTLVRTWRLSAVIAAGTVEPQTGDRIAIGGRTYVVGEVEPTKPDGVTAVVYAVELQA